MENKRKTPRIAKHYRFHYSFYSFIAIILLIVLSHNLENLSNTELVISTQLDDDLQFGAQVHTDTRILRD